MQTTASAVLKTTFGALALAASMGATFARPGVITREAFACTSWAGAYAYTRASLTKQGAKANKNCPIRLTAISSSSCSLAALIFPFAFSSPLFLTFHAELSKGSPAFAKLMTHPATFAELTGRNIAVGVSDKMTVVKRPAVHAGGPSAVLSPRG